MNEAIVESKAYRVADGVFVTWDGAAPRVGHVDHPFDVFEINADMAALIAGFTTASAVSDVFDALGVANAQRSSVLSAVDLLCEGGILTVVGADRGGKRGPLREAAFEAPRATSSCPDLVRTDPDFVEMYRSLSTVTLTSPQLAYALHNAVRHVARNAIEGDVVECGVWRGGSMALAAKTLLACGDSSRRLWLYDTFDWRWEQSGANDGFLAADPTTETQVLSAPDRDSPKGEEVSVSEVEALVRDTGYPPELIVPVQGLVQETIPDRVPTRIALLRLDTDLYDSTMHELEHLYPLLVSGGVLIIDDYGKLSGATRAVDDYFRGMSSVPLLQRIDIQGRVGVKR